MNLKYIAISILSLGALSACSGSSDAPAAAGHTPLAAITITEANAPTVVNSALDASVSADFGSMGPLGAQITPSTSTSNQRVLHNLNKLAFTKLMSQEGAPLQVIGVTQTIACTDGGTVAETTNDNNTSRSLTFSNCIEFGMTLNGSVSTSSMVITSSTLNGTLSMNVTAAVGGTSISYVGGYTYSATGVSTTSRTDRLYGSSLVMTINGLSEALSNFDFTSAFNDLNPTSYSDNVDFSLSSDFTGGSFTVATTQAFVTNTATLYPVSGIAIITGAGTSKLRASVVSSDPNAGQASGTVTLEVSSDGINYSTPIIKTWTEIAAS